MCSVNHVMRMSRSGSFDTPLIIVIEPPDKHISHLWNNMGRVRMDLGTGSRITGTSPVRPIIMFSGKYITVLVSRATCVLRFRLLNFAGQQYSNNGGDYIAHNWLTPD